MRFSRFLKVVFLIYLSLNLSQSRFQTWRRDFSSSKQAKQRDEARGKIINEVSEYLDFTKELIQPLVKEKSNLKSKSHQSDTVATLGSVIDGITGVLGSDRVANSIGKLGTSIGGLLKLSDSFISVIGSIGPFLGFLGPMLNFLSLFLGDPVEKKLDLIIEKIETLQEAMLRGFNRIENLIKAQDCRRSLKPAVDDITLAMGNLEEILKNSRNDPNGGTAQERREEYFIRLSTLGAKKENVERALSAIQSAFLGGSLAP